MVLGDGNSELSTQEVDWETKFDEGNRVFSRKFSRKFSNSEYISINEEEQMEFPKDETELKMDPKDENSELSTQEVDWETKFDEGNRCSSRKYSNREYISINVEEQPEHSKDEMEVKKHILTMKETLSKYEDFDPKPIGFCIYEVPEKLRVLNEDAYTPRVVSIGPIHHNKAHLQAMEPYKWRCLKRYLERSSLDLESIALITMRSEVHARAHYKDNFEKINKFGFSQMMMLDCVFVMEHFLECVLGKQWLLQTTCDPTIFGDQLLDRDILHDLMLLENQIPYSVLSELYTKGTRPYPVEISLYKLMHTYFKDVEFSETHYKQNEEMKQVKNARNKHLLDFLRESNSLVLRKPQVLINEQESHHKEVNKGNRRGKIERARTATELQAAGVNFKNNEQSNGRDDLTDDSATRFLKEDSSVSCSNCRETMKCACDIRFTSKGVLTIPQLKINDCTETFFRNLMAFEQCRRSEFDDMSITSYVILMDSLINTSKDVALLVKCGIIESSIGDNDQVLSLFSNLRKEIVMDNKDFTFTPLCEDLNTYSKDRLHQWKGSLLSWKRMLRRDYFSNPWSAISVVAGVILLILTIIQTVCAILQV